MGTKSRRYANIENLRSQIWLKQKMVPSKLTNSRQTMLILFNINLNSKKWVYLEDKTHKILSSEDLMGLVEVRVINVRIFFFGVN